ncbi:MAG: hypothetical protein RBQ94_03115 [Methanimicrococcus sp.]|nr:hypothetical protein [Methanimicrococcus sp.]
MENGNEIENGAERNKRPIFYLKEDGEDILSLIQNPKSVIDLKNGVYILGDNQGVFEEDEKIIEQKRASKISVGPISILSSQCITLILNALDRVSEKGPEE